MQTHNQCITLFVVVTVTKGLLIRATKKDCGGANVACRFFPQQHMLILLNVYGNGGVIQL